MIDLIKKSKSTEEAKKRIVSKSWTTSKNKWNLSKLMQECSDYMNIDDAVGLNDKNYTISNEQAQAILDMRLNKLTNLEQEVILKDYNDAVGSIKKYLKILSNPSELDNLMISELEEIKSLYGQNRRSLISDDEGLLNREAVSYTHLRAHET